MWGVRAGNQFEVVQEPSAPSQSTRINTLQTAQCYLTKTTHSEDFPLSNVTPNSQYSSLPVHKYLVSFPFLSSQVPCYQFCKERVSRVPLDRLLLHDHFMRSERDAADIYYSGTTFYWRNEVRCAPTGSGRPLMGCTRQTFCRHSVLVIRRPGNAARLTVVSTARLGGSVVSLVVFIWCSLCWNLLPLASSSDCRL